MVAINYSCMSYFRIQVVNHLWVLKLTENGLLVCFVTEKYVIKYFSLSSIRKKKTVYFAESETIVSNFPKRLWDNNKTIDNVLIIESG